MDKQIVEILHQYGFNDNQSAIYLTTLELGSAQASTIGRRSGVKRATAYSILQDFVSQGIASKIDKNQTPYYQVVTPSELLQKKKSQFEQFSKKFESSLPLFEEIQDPYQNKPYIRYFQGLAGLKDFYQDLIDENSDMKSFLGAHTIDPEMADYLNQVFLPARREKKLKAKVVLCNTEENTKYYGGLQEKYMINDEGLTEIKIVDHEIFKLYNQIDIYGEQKISFVSYSPDNMFAVIVESAFLHDSLVSIFDLVRKIG